MAQYQITVDQELLHRLFLGNNKDSGVSALLVLHHYTDSTEKISGDRNGVVGK